MAECVGIETRGDRAPAWTRHLHEGEVRLSRTYDHLVGGTATVLMFYGGDCGKAKAAVEQHVRTFPDARAVSCEALPDSSAAQPLNRLEFLIGTGRFIAFDSSVAHDFMPTPATSVWLDLDSEATLRSVASGIGDGGRVYMPIDRYRFSELFTWVEDRFGFSWQLNLRAPST